MANAHRTVTKLLFVNRDIWWLSYVLFTQFENYSNSMIFPDKFDQFWAVNRRLMDNKSSTTSGAAAAISVSSAAGTGSSESSETVTPSVFKHIPVRLYMCDSDASPPMHQRLVKPIVKTETSGDHLIEESELTGQIRQATLKDMVADMVPNRPLHEGESKGFFVSL